MGHEKTQRLVVLLYQTTIAIYSVFLMVHLFSLLDLALDLIRTCDTNNELIVFSDSLSVLKAMNYATSKYPQIQNLLEKMSQVFSE